MLTVDESFRHLAVGAFLSLQYYGRYVYLREF